MTRLLSIPLFLCLIDVAPFEVAAEQPKPPSKTKAQTKGKAPVKDGKIATAT